MLRRMLDESEFLSPHGLRSLSRWHRANPYRLRVNGYDFGEVHVRPAPDRPVPVWIGGESAPAVERAARLGDGWISGRTFPEVRPLLDLLHR